MDRQDQKKEIRTREDINLLVRHFYAKVQADEVLGPIFLTRVLDWEHHYGRLTDFWESQLLVRRTYVGNPLAVHQEVDAKTPGGISARHFGLWLNLWYETLDTLFEGEVATIAKNRARTMSTMMMLNIFGNRNRDIQAGDREI